MKFKNISDDGGSSLTLEKLREAAEKIRSASFDPVDYFENFQSFEEFMKQMKEQKRQEILAKETIDKFYRRIGKIK